MVYGQKLWKVFGFEIYMNEFEKLNVQYVLILYAHYLN